MSRPILQAIYDLEHSPMTFDVMFFVACANMMATREKLAGYTITFLHGPSGWRKKSHKDLWLTDDQKQWRLRQIHRPLAELAINCLGIGEYDKQDFASFLNRIDERLIFPPNYKSNNALKAYECQLFIKNKPRPQEFSVFSPSPVALSKVDEWLRARNFRRPVTMTLRTSTADSARNSNMQDWTAAATAIRSHGYDPIIIPDTDIGTTEVHQIDGIPTFCLGSLSVDLRLAMYRRALLNLSHGGGPAFLAWFADAGMLSFLPVDQIPVAANRSIDTMAELLGVRIGESWPTADLGRKFIWRSATTENIIEEFQKAASQFG